MPMIREEKVERLIQDDIDSILQFYNDYNETGFLYSVLSGDGWVPYNQLTDEQINDEYYDRFSEIDGIEDE